MRLFHSPTSPYARKVAITLEETGLASKVEMILASGSPLNDGTAPIAHNPLGKVPALERPDGPAIYDSRVICRYLDDLAGAGLYPTGSRLWDTLTLEATADGILDAALLMVYEGRLRPEDKQMPEWVEGQWLKIARSLDAIESRWMAHLAGPFDMGHIAVATAIGYIEFRHAARNWRENRPQLAAWYDKIAERPSMIATAPKA